jgi:hypothetical protein
VNLPEFGRETAAYAGVFVPAVLISGDMYTERAPNSREQRRMWDAARLAVVLRKS